MSVTKWMRHSKDHSIIKRKLIKAKTFMAKRWAYHPLISPTFLTIFMCLSFALRLHTLEQ